MAKEMGKWWWDDFEKF